jgi:hypothetical protein
MGQPVTVIEKRGARPGVVRFEINRSITGMGHEFFRSVDDAQGDHPAAALARVLLGRPGIDSVHVNSNVITVNLAEGGSADGIKELIEDLFLYYREGVEVAVHEGVEA